MFCAAENKGEARRGAMFCLCTDCYQKGGSKDQEMNNAGTVMSATNRVVPQFEMAMSVFPLQHPCLDGSTMPCKPTPCLVESRQNQFNSRLLLVNYGSGFGSTLKTIGQR